MSGAENNSRMVTWPQLSVVGAPLIVITGLALGAGAGWVNQLNEAQRRNFDSVERQADRNRERINEDLRALHALDNRIDRLEDEQTVDPRDLSAIITSLERRLDGLDEKTDRILQRLGEGLPGQTRGSP